MEGEESDYLLHRGVQKTVLPVPENAQETER